MLTYADDVAQYYIVSIRQHTCEDTYSMLQMTQYIVWHTWHEDTYYAYVSIRMRTHTVCCG